MTKSIKQKKTRRLSKDISKPYICPYDNCHKTYGSEVSLNLHIKLKHNGGNKTERERVGVTNFPFEMIIYRSYI